MIRPFLEASLALEGGVTLPAWAYAVEAALDRTWSARVEVLGDAAAAAWVGAKAVLASTEEALPLSLSGFVTDLEASQADDDAVVVTLQPALALLEHTGGHANFQDLDVVATTRQVLAAHAGLGPFDVRTQLVEAHPVREHRTQWGESDLAFLRRIWSEEGIAMWLGTEPGPEAVVQVSDATRLVEPTADLAYLPGAVTATTAPRDVLHAFRVRSANRLRTSVTRFRSYDAESPDHLPEGVAAAPGRPLAFDRFAHRTELGSADLTAARILGAARRDAHRLVLEATATLFPGTAFRLAGSPAHDGEWLVTRATTRVAAPRAAEGSAERSHQIEAAPRAVDVRPERVAKPRVFGALSATVVGDDHIDVDAQGRVLLRFPWDRRTSAERAPSRTTRRVRLAHPWAGPDLGHVTLPRVGQEVLVAFLEGDPDEPVVVGGMHNGRNAPPLDLPLEKTHSTWHSQSVPGGATFNEIRMIDDAGAELLSLFAGLDMEIDVTRDHRTHVGRDSLVQIDGSEKRVVRAVPRARSGPDSDRA